MAHQAVDNATQTRRIRAWYLFDWANQPYNTLLLTFVFAPYFVSAVAPDPVTGQAMWGWMLALAGIGVALTAPVLGAVADSAGRWRPWMVLWSALYVAGAGALWWAVPGAEALWPILLAFAIGMVGLEFGIVFANALLPGLAPRAALGRISGTGWALGYAGGVVALAVTLLVLAEGEDGRTLAGLAPPFGLDSAAREGTRAVGPFTALWYLVFVLPLFLAIPEHDRPRRAPGALRAGLAGLGRTLRGLPRHPSLLAYLASSMFYRDALNGIYAFGGIYAAGVLGWQITQIGVFGIVAAVVGAVACWLGGKADSAHGPKPVIAAGIVALIAVCVVVLGTDRGMVMWMPVAAGSAAPDIAFYFCGAVIGAAGGTLQAASRTMMVRQADPARMTEGFGLYALSGKVTAFLAPGLVALATQVTGDQRLGVAPLIVLFLVGLGLLCFVHPEGERASAWDTPDTPPGSAR
ncbi:MAG: MFS transporter [Alkalilacustris sp.]